MVISLCFLFLLAACEEGPISVADSASGPQSITVRADGLEQTVTTNAVTVRQLLDELGIEVAASDEVTPPLFNTITGVSLVTVVRVTESLEVIEEGIPFAREFIRSDAMGEEDPPLIVQGGRAGLQEVTIRITFRDGVETERQVITVNVIDEAVNEIVMIGTGVAAGNILFAGTLAYISGGRGILLRGATAFPEQIDLGGVPDGRVFSLSPTGEFLLYTLTESGGDFNSLWAVGTAADAEPTPLGAANVLWAGWDPSSITDPLIAYTTALPTTVAPGWEANNDLWLQELAIAEDSTLTLAEATLLIEAYPATLGWWGGNYAWSPAGRYIAYSFADEVGVIDTLTDSLAGRRWQLFDFIEFETLQDWVWIPSISWSPDGLYLAFTVHGGDDTASSEFDTWVVDVFSGVQGQFVPQAGMWGHPNWSPYGGGLTAADSSSAIALLKATDPIDSLRSSYTLWLVDQDGSNGRQIFPTPGESSDFPRQQQFMAWGPTGREMAFIFAESLYLHNLDSQETYRVTVDENVISRPTWAPYGAGSGQTVFVTPGDGLGELPTPEPRRTLSPSE